MKNLKEYGNGVKTIDSFLMKNECLELISISENHGFEEAAINTSYGQEIFKDIRNNDRIFFDDEILAKRLMNKLDRFLSEEILGWRLLGLNERFRFYRYTEEQYFKWHRDGSYKRDLGEQSFITFLVYLNEEFEGGETKFQGFEIEPKEGTALLFPHQLLHQGNAVKAGVKYVIRTDVMYEKL